MVASSLLRKAQLSLPVLGLLGLPNLVQEPGGVATVTGPTSTGRVANLRLQLDRERGTWEQTVVLGIV